MIKVTKKINLEQLDKEYNGQGLVGVLDDNGNYLTIGLASNNEGSEKDLEICLLNHIARDFEAETFSKKAALLEKLGITAEEANLLLS